MDKTSQRPVKNTNSKKKIIFFLLFILFVWLIVSNIKIMITYKEARANNLFAEKNTADLQNEISDLEKKIENIKTQQGVEEHIRLKYPLIKDGERVLVINTEEEIITEGKTFWQKIKDFIKTIF